MKTLLLLLCLTSHLSAADDIGRYQVISCPAKYLSLQKGAASSGNDIILIKLDTKTGDTWIFINMNVDGKNIEGWRKLEDLTNKSMKVEIQTNP